MNCTDHEKLTSDFRPDGLPTLIGSLPLADHARALELILTHTPEIPLWPQLPANPGEDMLRQFSEGLAGITMENDRIFFAADRPEFDEEMLHFFEDYLAAEEDPATTPARFQISRDLAAGLYLLAEKSPDLKDCVAFKGQITGPFTMLTGLKDQDQRLAYYNPQLRDMTVKGLAAKAAWQTKMLAAAGRPVLTFIDEPALAGLGSSAFISIDLDQLAGELAEVTGAIHAAGGLAGVHVCANTDWSLLLPPAAGVDIISFDAYGYFDRFVSDRDLVLSFLDRGGIIAWGIVPTGSEEKIAAETTESLVARWEEQAKTLGAGDLGPEEILSRTLITPSCGTGSLTLEMAERVLSLTASVSKTLRRKYIL